VTVIQKERSRFLFFGMLIIACLAYAVYTDESWICILPIAAISFQFGWRFSDQLFFILLLTVPFSFEYHFSSVLGTDVPDEFLMWLVTIVFTARLINNELPSRTIILRNPIAWVLILSLLWLLIATACSSEPLLSIKFLLAKTWYIAAFFLGALLLFQSQKNVVRAVVTMLVSLAIVLILIIVKHSQTGFSFASVNDAAFPFFRNHVNYAAMVACLFPVVIATIVLARKKSHKIIVASVAGLFLFALVFSYSRGAWLALIAAGIAVGLLRRRLLTRFYIFLLLILSLSIIYISSKDRYLSFAPQFRTTIFHKDFAEHLVATYKLKDVSTAERFYRWIAGARMVRANWLTGLGPNSFYDHYKAYTIPAYKTWVSNNADHSTVHNYFLLTAVEQGIPGLVLLLFMFGAMLWQAENLYHHAADRLTRVSAMAAASIVIILIVLNFLSDLIETDKIGSIYFLLMAFLISLRLRNQKA
jgi:O-antigen ligase